MTAIRIGFRTQNAIGAFIIFLLVILAYSPLWNGKFLWDDEFLVLRNPFIRSPVMGMEVFRHFLFTDAKGEFYRPMQNISYMIDYWRAGLDSGAYHWTNIIIHGLNGVLLFFLFQRLIVNLANIEQKRTRIVAFFVAGIWCLHPIHSAIAGYISGRADSLALAGILSAWLLWEKGVVTRLRSLRIGCYSVGLLLALAACCSKEIALAALGLFVTYLWLIRGGLTSRTKIITTATVLVVFLTYLLLRHLPDPNRLPFVSEGMAASEKCVLFFRAIGDYARLFVYPAKLFMERQVSTNTGLFTDPVKNDALFPWLGWVGGITVVLLLTSVLWKGNGQRLRRLGALWFFVMILPVSNLFSLNATVAEHWLYIPSIGLCLWLVGCVLNTNQAIQKFAPIVATLFLIGLGLRTYLRACDWTDPMTFYKATIRDGGDSIRVRLNLAAEYQKQGSLKEAERIYRSTLQAIPEFALAQVMLAKNLSLQGRVLEAEAIMPALKSSQLNPTGQVAALESALGSSPDNAALKVTEKAFLENPNFWPMAKLLASTYEQQNQIPKAIEIVRGFAARNWWHAESHNQLAQLHVANGQMREALRGYINATRLDIRDAEPLNQASVILAQNGQYAEAIRLQEKAVLRNNGPRQQEILATLRQMAGARN